MIVFFLFAGVLIFLGYKSLRGGFDYLAFFKHELAKPASDYTPFCSIIAPCRGLDQDLKENLAALLHQNYPEYEVIFVVDNENDEAVPVIEKLINRRDAETQRILNKDKIIKENSASPRLCGEKIVVAGKTKDSSQKVENLREGVLRVSEKSEVFVFVDSDARPHEDWLRNLIAPLQNENVGAATGYRWFISRKNNFASHLRSVWNASIASALGANVKSNFCWGGSTAIRRDQFENIKMRERWKGTLSDDFAVTRAMKAADLPIVFVPQALIASVEDCNMREMLEFTTRQMKITRVYAPHLWKASFIGSILFTSVFFTNIALLFFVSGWQFWLALFILLLNIALGVGKAWLRLNAVKLVLKKYEKELNQSFLPQITIWALTPPIYFYNCVCAFFSNEIRWRGIRYKLKSANETIVIEDD